MYRDRLGHILGLEALLVVDISLEFPAQFACLVGEENIQSLFGENGAGGGATALFCACRNGCLGVFERKGNGHLYGATERNHTYLNRL